MKIISISDIHGYLPKLPKCDIVTIAGDIVPVNIQRQYESCISWLSGPFQEWALNLDCKKVIFIAGNHDFVFEYLSNNGVHSAIENDIRTYNGYLDPISIMNMLFQLDNVDDPKIIYLQDSAYIYNNIKFYGTPWCPELKNWAFYGDSKKLYNKFNEIQEDTDILITHCPPKYGLQGTVLETNWNYMTDFGCVELQQVIDEKFFFKDMWVLSGHIHSGNHKIEKFNDVKYINTSIKDENYSVTYKPFEFEI